MRRGKFIGLIGGNLQKLRAKVGWVLEIWRPSIWPCLRNKDGDFFIGDDSLLFKVFKTKYFPNTSFLEAKPKQASSWAWQSILASREIIAKRWQWQVANGEYIDIWNDPWLMDPLYPKVLTPNPNNASWRKVSDLVDKDIHAWNAELIKGIFLERDANQILSIPISTTGLKDSKIWRLTSNGKFTEKTAYVLAKEGVCHGSGGGSRGQTSGTNEDEEKWRRVWKITAPMKVRNFIWFAS